MNCQTTDCWYHKNEKLGLGVYVLSTHDTQRKIDQDEITYDRVTVLRCPNGHNSKVNSQVVISVFPEPVEPARDDSVKRFHRKGFRGHRIGERYVRPTYPPTLTNHQRMLERRV